MSEKIKRIKETEDGVELEYHKPASSTFWPQFLGLIVGLIIGAFVTYQTRLSIGSDFTSYAQKQVSIDERQNAAIGRLMDLECRLDSNCYRVGNNYFSLQPGKRNSTVIGHSNE